jgi:hypothetical protein
MTTRPEDQGSRVPSSGPQEMQPAYGEPRRRTGGRPRQSMGETVIKSVLRSLASSIGRAIARALVGRRR